MDRGRSDSRDASAFIERTLYAADERPEPVAGDALERLIENLAPSYAETATLALAFQRWARRDCGHTVPAIADLRTLMAVTRRIPAAARVRFQDRMQALRERTTASSTCVREGCRSGEGPKYAYSVSRASKIGTSSRSTPSRRAKAQRLTRKDFGAVAAAMTRIILDGCCGSSASSR